MTRPAVNDRVIATRTFRHDGAEFQKGMTGTVVALDKERGIIAVSWDNWNNGHSVSGKLSNKSGYWVKPTHLDKINEPKQAERKVLKKLDIKIENRNQIVGQDEVKSHLEVAVRSNYPVLLVGDTGTGKTSIVRELAVTHGHVWSRFNLTGETTVDEFVGKWTLQDGNTIWQDGILLQAMRKGHWLVVDEINVALPEILFVLHSLLDDDKFVVVPQKDGEVVKPHPQFRFFGTMNPVDEYAGTKDLNKAFKSRFNMIINMGYPEKEIEVEIVKQKCEIPEETARQIVDVGAFVRQLKQEDKVFYTCSTRDLIQWGNLIAGGLDMERSFELSIMNKANGDGEEIKKVYEKVVGEYKKLHKKGFEELSIDMFNSMAHEIEKREKELENSRKEFEAHREALIDEVKEETIRRLLHDSAKKAETKTKKAPAKRKTTAKKAKTTTKKTSK